MSKMSDKKRTKSFSLKNENADKIELLSFNTKKTESELIDKMLEEFNGNK